jgi:retron-type reverse transcriptase
MLTAGVMEDGRRVSSVAGTPQGGTLSPLLSNVYGHALDALCSRRLSMEMDGAGTAGLLGDGVL